MKYDALRAVLTASSAEGCFLGNSCMAESSPNTTKEGEVLPTMVLKLIVRTRRNCILEYSVDDFVISLGLSTMCMLLILFPWHYSWCHKP